MPRSISNLIISFLFLWSTAAWCQVYDLSRFEEFTGLKWGMSPNEVVKSTKFSLQDRVSDSQYIENGRFHSKPSQYHFSFYENGLQSIVITMKASKQEIIEVKEHFIKLYGEPTIYDPGKNAYQWRDNSQEATMAILPPPTSRLLIGFRKINSVTSGSKCRPEKLSSLQGVYLGMAVDELQELSHLQPLDKFSEQVYKTRTFFNSRPSTASFIFRNGILNAIGLDFTIENTSRSEVLKLFLEYKEFLTSKYGIPTYENLDIPSILWKQGYCNTLFRWLEKDSSFVLFFKENK